MQILKRNAISRLQKWYKNPKRKPLILLGARQVGKTTLIHIFAKQHNLTFYYINLEDPETKEEYSKMRSAKDILQYLAIKHKKAVVPNTLIFFDEIQNVPRLIQLLRFFKEDYPQYAVIASGSWLNIYLEKFMKDKTFSFPVGRVDFMTLHPFTFLEYLHNSNPSAYATLVETPPNKYHTLTALHPFFLKEFQKYMILGGMPAVLSTCNLDICPAIEQEQKQLLTNLIEDISKYLPGEIDRVTKIFRTIYLYPARAITKNKILPSTNIRTINKLIGALSRSLVITEVQRTYARKLPITASPRPAPKYLALDTGLSLNLSKLTESLIPLINNPTEFYQVLEDSQKGYITEQIVGQHLLAVFFDPYLPQTDSLFYWQNKDGRAEVDFLLPYKGKLVGIEVKSGKVGKLRSLIEFLNKTHNSIGIRIYNGQFKVEEITLTQKPIISIPLYMVELIPNIIDKYY